MRLFVFFSKRNQSIDQTLAVQGTPFDAGVAGLFEKLAVPFVFVRTTRLVFRK